MSYQPPPSETKPVRVEAPDRQTPEAPTAADFSINIRNLSIQCGHCQTYQTLVRFARREEWNVYTYECENDQCDPEVTRTLLEVPVELDAFARRDPEWRGGQKWGGAE